MHRTPVEGGGLERFFALWQKSKPYQDPGVPLQSGSSLVLQPHLALLSPSYVKGALVPLGFFLPLNTSLSHLAVGLPLHSPHLG